MPLKNRTFYNSFVFSLAPILPDLEASVSSALTELSTQPFKATEGDLVTAWVIYQLERHAHLALEYNAILEIARHLTLMTDKRFFEGNSAARDLLLSQVLPVLTCRESIPYTDRICRLWTRLPDLHLQFL